MPHIRIETKEVWAFDELDESAREKARDWYREGALDYDWWEFVYEDAAKCAEILGIDLRSKPVKLVSGATRLDPAIYFSGFYSQGDGARYEGTYAYAKGSTKAIRRHAPKDAELHRIADGLWDIQKRNRWALTASIGHRGWYDHSGTMDIDIDDCTETDCEDMRQLLRDFADWIYSQLKAEYEYQMADEQVDESIRANEYEFDEFGRIA